MDACLDSASSRFARDLGTANDLVQAATSRSRVVATHNTWDKWKEFCAEENVDPLLHGIVDKIPFLLVFAVRYHDGTLSKSGKRVRAGTVDDAIRDVGQTMEALGVPDP